MMNENKFGLKSAIEALLENFIVQRKDDPDLFREILRNEKIIRKYMINNFGYQIKLESEIAKVEKIPYFGREWMGVQNFKDELDYVFLMALYASLETKTFEDGLLLSSLIDEIKKFLIEIHDVDWKIRYQRESLARALMYAQATGFIRVRDGELSDFEKSEEGEVLYESTSLIRYQFRNLSKRMDDFKTTEEMRFDGLNMENARHTFFRKLYFESVLFFNELSDAELELLNDETNYIDIKTQIEEFTFFRLERMYQCIYLTYSERKLNLQQHPSRKHDSYIVSQVAYMFVQKLINMEEKPFNLVVLRNSEFEELLRETKEYFYLGWSKKMRETTFAKYKKMVLHYMLSWKLADYDDDIMQVTIYPSFIRTIGEYEPELRDFINSEIIKNKNMVGSR